MGRPDKLPPRILRAMHSTADEAPPPTTMEAARGTARLAILVGANTRLKAAPLAAIVAIPLGVVMSALMPWDPGRSLNLNHAVLIIAPPAAAIAGVLLGRLVLRRPYAAIIGMIVVTWAAGILLWPVASIVMPFWTGELSCIAIDSSCTPTAGMSTQQILDRGLEQFLGWYQAILAAPFFTWIYVPAIAAGAAAWAILLRRWMG